MLTNANITKIYKLTTQSRTEYLVAFGADLWANAVTKFLLGRPAAWYLDEIIVEQ